MSNQLAVVPVRSLGPKPKAKKKQMQPKKKPTNQKQQRPKTKQPPRQNPKGPFFRLSNCSLMYATALTDPFKLLNGVCIPDIHDLPSWKLRTLARGTFTTGTNKMGFIVVSSKSSSNNAGAGKYSDGNFTGSTIPANLATGTNYLLNKQYPYNETDSFNGVTQARAVACGVRARYIGTELNKSGRMILFRYPTDQTVAGADDATLLSRAETISMPVSRSWRTITYIPQRPDDYAYTKGAYQISSVGENQDLGIMVAGSEHDNTFEFEVVWYHEIISGTASSPNLSPTHSDVAGLSAIRNSLEGSNFEGGPSATNTLLRLIRDHAPAEVSRFVSGASLAYQAASNVYNAIA